MRSVPISEHTMRRRVQFAETDMAGMVHFSWHLRYMEEAEHDMWRAAGLSIAPTDGTIGFPRVAAAVEYHAPLRFEDEFDVHVRITALGRRSITYACTVTRGDTPIATGTITAVCVQKAPTLRAIDIPTEITARLAPSTRSQVI